MPGVEIKSFLSPLRPLALMEDDSFELCWSQSWTDQHGGWGDRVISWLTLLLSFLPAHVLPAVLFSTCCPAWLCSSFRQMQQASVSLTKWALLVEPGVLFKSISSAPLSVLFISLITYVVFTPKMWQQCWSQSVKLFFFLQDNHKGLFGFKGLFLTTVGKEKKHS